MEVPYLELKFSWTRLHVRNQTFSLPQDFKSIRVSYKQKMSIPSTLSSRRISISSGGWAPKFAHHRSRLLNPITAQRASQLLLKYVVRKQTHTHNSPPFYRYNWARMLSVCVRQMKTDGERPLHTWCIQSTDKKSSLSEGFESSNYAISNCHFPFPALFRCALNITSKNRAPTLRRWFPQSEIGSGAPRAGQRVQHAPVQTQAYCSNMPFRKKWLYRTRLRLLLDKGVGSQCFPVFLAHKRKFLCNSPMKFKIVSSLSVTDLKLITDQALQVRDKKENDLE